MDTNFDIGKLLTTLQNTRKFMRSDITSQMKVSSSSFYGYEMRNSLQSSVIFRLCHAMKYNLFMDMANCLPADYDYDKSKVAGREALLEQLQNENTKLKLENELLKEMMVRRASI